MSAARDGGSYNARGSVLALDGKVTAAQTYGVKVRVPLMFVLLTAALTGFTQSPTPDPALYGAYPTNYKMIVIGWLNKRLADPVTAQIEWKGEPQPADLGTRGEHLYGYLVNFTVNARNRFGAYTGKQAHGALIRNGEVIKGVGLGY